MLIRVLSIFFVLSIGALAAEAPSATSQELCRVGEKCYAISALIVGAKGSKPRVAGVWPYPGENELHVKVGDRLHFAWESRNEYYDDKNIWVKGDPQVHSKWEAEPGPDACTGKNSADWIARSPVGEVDLVIKPCQAGRRYVLTLAAHALGPKAQARLEIEVTGALALRQNPPPGDPWIPPAAQGGPTPAREPAAASSPTPTPTPTPTPSSRQPTLPSPTPVPSARAPTDSEALDSLLKETAL